MSEAELPNVPDYRKCGLCYSGHGGVGVAYCTQGRTRYYKCEHCGNTWTVTVRLEIVRVEQRVVDLETREN